MVAGETELENSASPSRVQPEDPLTEEIAAKFYCGVVEGFYGRPWTTDQRRSLFKRMQSFGMDTYLYAPKDDCKHRMYWRDLYSVEEAEHLTGLIEAAAEHNVTFVYALSPGLDIGYSNSKEVTCLKRKLEQVATFGCKAFALLFDDIDVDMNEADKAIFQSFAQAQVSVTNEVYQHLDQPTRFLFCPTEYCSTRAVPNVNQSEYLNTIGSKLLQGIDVMWTGPKVISKMLTVEHVNEIATVLRRPPVIWDNIHANDYDQKRLFLGPYEGRPTQIIPLLRGVMTNPNCEFEANYIAIHTLSQWAKSSPGSPEKESLLGSSPVSSDIKLETEGEIADDLLFNGYKPREALHKAIKDWMLEFGKECAAPTKKVAHVSAPPVPQTSNSIPVPDSIAPPTCNLNGLNAVEVNESYMQPTSLATVNSLIDPSSDSDIDSAVEQGEPMDCVAPDSALGAEPVVPMPEDPAKSILSGYDSGCGDCIDKPENMEKMQVDPEGIAEASIVASASTLSSLLSGCDTCADSLLHEAGGVSCEDLHLLVDLFYMPFEHGSKSVKLLSELQWLKLNCSCLIDARSKTASEESISRSNEWNDRAAIFRDQLNHILTTLDKFQKVPNKAILQDLYTYMWDMRTILTIVDAFIAWLALGLVPSISIYYLQGNPYTWASLYYQDAFHSGDQEPWMFRGGLQAEFQRLLPLEGVADLLLPTVPQTFASKMLKVRPYRHSDESAVYEICRKTCDDGLDSTDIFPEHPDLMGDRNVGSYLTLSPEYCFVVEDQNGKVIGYTVASLDAREFYKKVEMSWIMEMQMKYQKPEKEEGLGPAEEMKLSFHSYKPYCPDALYNRYPSMLRIDVLPSCEEDPTACKRLLAATVAALKTNGSHGIHTELDVGDQNVLNKYTKLQFYDVPMTDIPEDKVILGRVI